jgi:uncharacterized membrane protein YfcA
MSVPLEQLAWIAAFALAAAVTQSTIGFGSAVLFTPLATLVIGAHSAVATSIVIGSVLSLALYAEYRPRAPLAGMLPLAVLGTLATPLGIWVLAHASEATVRALVGFVVLAGAAVTLRSRPRLESRAAPLPASVAVGALSGVLRGATSMGGPPVLLYVHWLGGGPATIRGRMFAYFALFTIPGVLIAWLGGVIGARELEQSLAAVPAMLAGIVLGRWARPRVSDVWFRRSSMALLAFTSAVALGAALAALA